MSHQRTLIIIKPDAIQRNLLGEIISRFEKKGLKIIGLKMAKLDDAVLAEHYSQHKDKPFFSSLRDFMKTSPVVVMVLAGFNAIESTRLIVGPTRGYEADAGSIRGDFSLSAQSNIVHASDSPAAAEAEIDRFFKAAEIFDYVKAEYPYIYAPDEKALD